MNLKLLKGKIGRTRLFAAIGIIAVLLTLALNLFITYFGVHRAFYIDTTPEGLYSLSDAMKQECAFVDELDADDKKVKITFCTDPDILISSDTTRATYFMALQLDNYLDNLEVETVNVAYNHTAVSKYKPTSLSKIEGSDIIVSYGDRYRVVSADSFWTAGTDGTLWAYNGEYRMASIIMSVTAKERPAAYFVTNHGETYYNPADPATAEKAAYIYDLCDERGLDVKTLDLSTQEIPDDCVLLIINNPTSDFLFDEDRLDEYGYISETEKIDRYLVKGHGSIMVAADPSTELPVLKSFLREWGFDIHSSIVEDSENYMVNTDGTYDKIMGRYDTDEDSYGYAIYESIASIPSAPAMVFNKTGYITCSYEVAESEPEAGTYAVSRNYAPFFYGYDSARAKSVGAGEITALGGMHLAAVTTRMEIDQYTAEYKYSYVFCSASADFFLNEVLGNSSYANYEVVSALVENMARVDEYASLELGGSSYNSPTAGGKSLLDVSISKTDIYRYDSEAKEEVIAVYGLSDGDAIAITVALMLLPLAAAVFGIVIAVKRRFL